MLIEVNGQHLRPGGGESNRNLQRTSGFRAAAFVIRKYYRLHGNTTISKQNEFHMPSSRARKGTDSMAGSCRAMVLGLEQLSHLHHVTEVVTLRQAKRMIKSFRQKGLKRLFVTGDHRGVPPGLAPRISRLLDALDIAEKVVDLNLPGFGLHELKGNRKGIWALKLNKNWRITFRFESGNAYDVDLEDYH